MGTNEYANLAQHDDFRLGDTLISPVSREVRGPGGATAIEPRVMQVLLVLARSVGEVVTREDLLRSCWGNQVVGDDALNRAVAEVRRIARTIATDGFRVETIPRTGYRLVGATLTAVPAATESLPLPATASEAPASRRLFLGLAGAGFAAAAAAATWALWPDATADRVTDLAEQARIALVDDLPEGNARGVGLLNEAVKLAPRDAGLWGRLALAWRATAEYAEPDEMATIVPACRLAAARALALDSTQADARAALVLLRSSFGDWLTAERELRVILADAPTNDAATVGLQTLLQSVGRTRAAIQVNEPLMARSPLSPDYQFRRMFLLWASGRLGEADRTIDRAKQLWPRHPRIWIASLMLLGCTGRAAAAVGQIDDLATRPPGMPDEVAAMLRRSMQAIRTRDPALLKVAVADNLDAAVAGPAGAARSLILLAAMNELDAAFAVAEGYFLRRGPYIMPLRPSTAEAPGPDPLHRHTPMLFLPVAQTMRADPRFLNLCRECGLVDYWRQSGEWPDYLGTQRL